MTKRGCFLVFEPGPHKYFGTSVQLIQIYLRWESFAFRASKLVNVLPHQYSMMGIQIDVVLVLGGLWLPPTVSGVTPRTGIRRDYGYLPLCRGYPPPPPPPPKTGIHKVRCFPVKYSFLLSLACVDLKAFRLKTSQMRITEHICCVFYRLSELDCLKFFLIIICFFLSKMSPLSKKKLTSKIDDVKLNI